MKTFSTDFTPIALALFLVAGAHSLNTASVRSDDSVVGAWKSYSVATFGTTTAEFRADGTCRFNESVGAQFSCKWTRLGQGQIRIVVNESGKNDVFSAGLEGDRLVVNESGRKPYFVRADSKFAYERQLLSKADR